ncbi:glycosyltransferase family 25 protein [Candidatus Thioglobus sp.]|uniref:glycosyltransferase family 25 protein n=1 Tax=Candidatus Thioglobus sp. TaxID=2026721 RepID=UPI003D0DD4AF
MNILIISLTSATQRRKFQQEQLAKLNLNFEFLAATSANDINSATYKKHYHDWQRPLKKTEVACYYSHRHAWDKVIQSNQPALILEDDALLSKCVPELLKEFTNKKNTDLINLENRGRKKFVSRSGKSIACDSKLLCLYQDRTGAAGYILWPSGAKKLIQCEKDKGIALADAHITACNSLKAYQVEPAPIIQLDHCAYYGINSSANAATSISTVSSHHNAKGTTSFWLKRIYFQIKLGIRQLLLILKSERRYISIKVENFYKPMATTSSSKRHKKH